MSVGFGAKSGLSALALLRPGTHPSSAAPRSSLARSWPQKCQFHSNLGLKGIWERAEANAGAERFGNNPAWCE